jgi:hypothetical protein
MASICLIYFTFSRFNPKNLSNGVLTQQLIFSLFVDYSLAIELILFKQLISHIQENNNRAQSKRYHW